MIIVRGVVQGIKDYQTKDGKAMAKVRILSIGNDPFDSDFIDVTVFNSDINQLKDFRVGTETSISVRVSIFNGNIGFNFDSFSSLKSESELSRKLKKAV